MCLLSLPPLMVLRDGLGRSDPALVFVSATAICVRLVLSLTLGSSRFEPNLKHH